MALEAAMARFRSAKRGLVLLGSGAGVRVGEVGEVGGGRAGGARGRGKGTAEGRRDEPFDINFERNLHRTTSSASFRPKREERKTHPPTYSLSAGGAVLGVAPGAGLLVSEAQHFPVCVRMRVSKSAERTVLGRNALRC